MPTIYMTRGLPGSGKSTWAKAKAAESGALRWNNDEFCEMLTGRRYGRVDSKLLGQVRTQFIIAAVGRQADVIVDNTNLNPYTTKDVEATLSMLAQQAHGYVIINKLFPVTLEVAHERNARRDIPVPTDVIDNMHRKWILGGHWPELDV